MTSIITISDALVTVLNGHTFSEPFTAARSYRPVFDLKEMADLHVTVVPHGIEMSMVGRNVAQDDVQIDLAVQKRLSAPENEDAELDALMALVLEIADFVRSTGQFAGAIWINTENVPIFSPEHLSELRQFTSVLTLTFRVIA